MKLINRFGLILSVVLIVIYIFAYIDYKQLLIQIEQENLPIDVMFNGWAVAISFLIISLYELIIKNKHIKLLIRILLMLLFLGIIFRNVIPIESFDSGLENMTVFSGMITIIFFLVYGLKKVYDKKYKLPAANKQ